MIETTNAWWKTESRDEVSEVLSLLNEARLVSNNVRGFQVLAEATNLLWTQLYKFQKREGLLKPEHEAKGRGDTASFEELLKVSLHNGDKHKIASTREFRALVDLNPPVMSHEVLRRRNYSPTQISESLREEASEKHLELVRTFQQYSSQCSDESIGRVFKKLADLLFVIRSNIAHGEKTPRGPDLDKVRRDQQVCKCARPVLEMIMDAVCDRPDSRLAVYGTLAPGQANYSKLSELGGHWITARINGKVRQIDGLPHFVWDLSAPELIVNVFESTELEQHWVDLDRFEGDSYRRIWVVVVDDEGKLSVANIYSQRDLETEI